MGSEGAIQQAARRKGRHLFALLPTMTRCWSLALLLFLSLTSMVSSAASSGGARKRRPSNNNISPWIFYMMGGMGGFSPYGYNPYNPYYSGTNEYGYPNQFGLGSNLFQ